MQFVIYGIIVIALVILVRNIRIVPQAQAYVITRLGAYKTTWGVGLHLKVPFIEAVAKRLSLKEQVADFPPQPVITKDNVTMQIDTVVYYQITDPKLYTYGIEQPILAIENLSATTLRNLIGDLELDQCLTSRDIVNTKMRQILDEATRRARFSTYASRCIENELRMHFRRERKNAPTLSLQETLDAGKEDSALTLADVLQDGFCMEDSCEKQDDAQRLRRLIEGLPARERKLILLRYGLAGQPPLTQLETAKLLQISRSYVSRLETHALELLRAGWEQP